MVIDREHHATEIEAAFGAFDFLRDRALAPLSTRSPREFAETIMRMPDAHGATRPFSFGFGPYQLEPFLEIFNPRNIEVDMMMASRLGKSRIVLTALGFVIVEQPCRIGVMWPVEGDAKLWSKDDFMGELVEPTPEIAALIDDARGQRKSKNTLLHKSFPGGLLQAMGGNAPGRMRRMKARLLYADEIDAIIEILTDEGDQLKIFAKRGAEFPDCIQIYCSYPSVKGRSRIEAKLLASDLRQWCVTCLLCGGEPMIMSRTGLDPFGDKKPRTKLLYDKERPQDARLECPLCHDHLDDLQRYAMMMGGDPDEPRYDLWQPTREFRGRAGFHLSSLAWPHPVDPEKYPGGFLEVLARKEIEVEESENPERTLRVLMNTDDAETFESANDAKPEHTALFQRREPYDPAKMLPAGVLWCAILWDVQNNRCEGEIIGYGLRNETWGLGYHVVTGSTLAQPHEGVWAEMDRLFTTTTFPHPSGKTLRIEGELVDRGFRPDNVLAYTRPRIRRGTYASRGATQLSKPIIRNRAGWEGNPRARVWELGTHEAKDILYQRLDFDPPRKKDGTIRFDGHFPPGYMHYPQLGCYSEQYFKMLTAEDSDMQKAGDGKYYRCFTCAEGVRNEALDIRVGSLAIIRIRKPKLPQLAEELRVLKPGEKPGKSSANAKPTEKPAGKVCPQTSKGFVRKVLPGARTGGFVGGWK